MVAYTPELHADNLEGILAQSPGLKVVIPSGPYDAKGLLISSIRSNDPVVYLEHMKLYRSFREEVPEEEYTIDIGKANVKKKVMTFQSSHTVHGSRINESCRRT